MGLVRNVKLGKPLKLSAWRKIAIGTWRTAGDPSVYGIIEADVRPAMNYLEKLREESGARVTLTHFIGRCLAEVFSRHPEINAILRLGRLYPRESVDIFFQIAADSEGKELSGFVIRNADKKSILEIAREMDERVEDVRKKGDPGYKKMKGLLSLIPGFATHAAISLTGFLLYTCNLWTKLIGTPRDPFGSAMVTNIGSLGLDMAYVPLVPWSRVPMVMAIGAVSERVVVEYGQVTTAPISRICVTFDHRLIDGVHASQMIKTFNQVLAHPETELS